MPRKADPGAARLRAGSRALLLLADSVSVSILLQLAPGPLENAELLERIGFVSRSTYFERMRNLEDLSLLSRTRRGDVPPVAVCRLKTSGTRLLPVARRLDAWLGSAPNGPLRLGDAYATAAIKALAIAWGSTLLRWVAESPRTIAELERLVDVVGYRKLERVLRGLIEVGLLERAPIEGRLPAYGVTEWGRWAASFLTSAMRWERHEISKQSALVSSIEAEGVMLLGLPLIELPGEESGTCALLVEDEASQGKGLGGAVVRLSDGRPLSWGAAGAAEHEVIERAADCWMRGTTLTWLSTPTETSVPSLRMGGDTDFAEKVLAALRDIAARSPDLEPEDDVKPAHLDPLL